MSKPERIRMEGKSVQPSRLRNFRNEDQPITEQRTEDSLFSDSNNAKEQRRTLHLFNCCRTYKLDAVVDLLAAMKLGFDLVVVKHYLSRAQISEMTTNTIPKLVMDMAFFVVHAHEYRLSINDDNAEIGYPKIYRALLEATGEY